MGEILLLIPTLQGISREMVDIIQFSQIFGYAHIDRIVFGSGIFNHLAPTFLFKLTKKY